jgi:hypothetical protein
MISIEGYHAKAKRLHRRPDKPIPGADRAALREVGIEVADNGIPLLGQSSVLTADRGPSLYMLRPDSYALEAQSDPQWEGATAGGYWIIYDIRHTPYRDVGMDMSYNAAYWTVRRLIATDLRRIGEKGDTDGVRTSADVAASPSRTTG